MRERERGIESSRAITAAGTRSSDVSKSLRWMLAREDRRTRYDVCFSAHEVTKPSPPRKLLITRRCNNLGFLDASTDLPTPDRDTPPEFVARLNVLRASPM